MYVYIFSNSILTGKFRKFLYFFNNISSPHRHGGNLERTLQLVEKVE